MAGTTTTSTVTTHTESDVRDVIVEHNKLVDDVEALRSGLANLGASFNLLLTKLDADVGVTDGDYSSTRAVTVTTYDAAGDLTAAKVGNRSGTALS